MSTPKPAAPGPEPSVSRREFLVRLGITGALIAGTGLAAKKLWQPGHFVPGFQKEAGLQLRSYALEPNKLLPSLAIAHGRNIALRLQTLRRLVGRVNGLGCGFCG